MQVINTTMYNNIHVTNTQHVDVRRMHRYELNTLKSNHRSMSSILQKHFPHENVFFFFSDGGGTQEPQGISPHCESVKSCLLGQADAHSRQMGTLVSASWPQTHSKESESVLFWFLCKRCTWTPIFVLLNGKPWGKHFKRRQESSQETAAAWEYELPLL